MGIYVTVQGGRERKRESDREREGGRGTERGS